MAFANGMYKSSLSDVADFADLHGCGCDSGATPGQATGFFDSVPTWVWIGALAVGAMMALKKGR